MAAKGYDSHRPLLIETGRVFGHRIKRIMELGSGFYSSSVFLDRTHFPNVESFISYETERKWYKTVSEVLSGAIEEGRLDYRLYNKFEEVDVSLTGDLLFVDGVKRHRKQILARMHNNFDLIICHDTDLWWFTDKERSYFKYLWEYKPRGRHTGIMSNFIDVESVNWFTK